MHDYFDILGVPRNARGEEIRRACRGRIRLTHPDIDAADETRSAWTSQLADANVSFPDMTSIVRRMRDAFFGS